MKSLLLLPLLTLTTPTLAHWTYDRLIVSNTTISTTPYQHIRRPNNTNVPLQDLNSTSLRCNSGASSGIPLNTTTALVTAGTELGFTISDTFGHPGPQQVYISPAPEGVSAAEYDGSGEWTKIYTLSYSLNGTSGGASDGVLKWATHRARSFRFVLPRETPAGEYLLRAEGLALHAAHKVDKAQFYVGCAQIKVVGGAEGEIGGEKIKFPGGYLWNSTGVLIPEFWSRITEYEAPGPRLWPEGTKVEHVLVGTVKGRDD